MAMIVNATYTQIIRQDSIRLLSGRIDTFTISDNELEIIGERADFYIFDSVGQFIWDGLEDDFALLISASNCTAAAEILRGIGGSNNETMANDLTDKVNAIISTMNGNSPQQLKPAFGKTGGINNMDGTFG